MFGMLTCRLALLPRNPEQDDAMAQRLQRVTGGALALLTLASLGILLSRTLELDGGVWGTLPADMRLALRVTHFGHVWLWRVPALAMAWIAWPRAVRRRSATWIMLIATAAIALTRSETGHPADHGDFTLAVWVDWVHTLAAGAWVGSLFAMTLAVFPRLAAAGGNAAVIGAAIFQRLSTLSGAALAILLAAGIYNVYTQLGGVTSLWTSRYGAALDVKLALVLLMIAIGAHNRYIKLPRLLACAGQPARPAVLARWIPARMRGTSPRPLHEILRGCARAVLIESLLGLAAIGATATLIHAMPPADMPMPQSMQAHVRATPQGSSAISPQEFAVAPGTAR